MNLLVLLIHEPSGSPNTSPHNGKNSLLPTTNLTINSKINLPPNIQVGYVIIYHSTHYYKWDYPHPLVILKKSQRVPQKGKKYVLSNAHFFIDYGWLIHLLNN